MNLPLNNKMRGSKALQKPPNYLYTRRHTKEIITSVGDVFVPMYTVCVTSILSRFESDYRLGTLVTVTNTSNHL